MSANNSTDSRPSQPYNYRPATITDESKGVLVVQYHENAVVGRFRVGCGEKPTKCPHMIHCYNPIPICGLRTTLGRNHCGEALPKD